MDLGSIIEWLGNFFLYLMDCIRWALTAIVNMLIHIFMSICHMAAQLVPTIDIP